LPRHLAELSGHLPELPTHLTGLAGVLPKLPGVLPELSGQLPELSRHLSDLPGHLTSLAAQGPCRSRDVRNGSGAAHRDLQAVLFLEFSQRQSSPRADEGVKVVRINSPGHLEVNAGCSAILAE